MLWKDIKGYENKYQISEYGDVKRLPRTMIDSLGRKKELKEKIFKPHKGNNGYVRVSYGMNRDFCHRVVAKAFLENPHNFSEINHIDGNKLNNHYTNLEWCSRKENCEHASKNGLINKHSLKRKKQTKLNQKKSVIANRKPVLQLADDGQIIKKFKSAKEAAIITGIKEKAIGSACRKEKYRTRAGGYHWIYEKEYSHS